jgi:hypothetical protein
VFPMMPSAHCLDEGVITLLGGCVNCAIDLWVAILPIPMIMKLQMPLKRRLGVIFLLSLGFIVVIAGIVRSYFVWYSLIKSYDQTWVLYVHRARGRATNRFQMVLLSTLDLCGGGDSLGSCKSMSHCIRCRNSESPNHKD